MWARVCKAWSPGCRLTLLTITVDRRPPSHRQTRATVLNRWLPRTPLVVAVSMLDLDLSLPIAIVRALLAMSAPYLWRLIVQRRGRRLFWARAPAFRQYELTIDTDRRTITAVSGRGLQTDGTA